MPAIEFGRLLRLLDNNLQALQSAMQGAASLGEIDLTFPTPIGILLAVSSYL